MQFLSVSVNQLDDIGTVKKKKLVPMHSISKRRKNSNLNMKMTIPPTRILMTSMITIIRVERRMNWQFRLKEVSLALSD